MSDNGTHPIGYMKQIHSPQASDAKHIVGLYPYRIPLLLGFNFRGVIDSDDSMVCRRVNKCKFGTLCFGCTNKPVDPVW